MAEIKRKFKLFLVTQEGAEQRWLEQQQRDGWKLLGITFPGIYTFEKCEPEEVVYQLDYNPEGLKDKKNYLKPFEDLGWEYMDDMSGYAYFCKPKVQVTEEDDIFRKMSDDERYTRLFKGQMIPMLIIFCVCVVPGVIRSYCRQSWGLFAFWAVMAVIYVVILTGYAIGYYKYKHKK